MGKHLTNFLLILMWLTNLFMLAYNIVIREWIPFTLLLVMLISLPLCNMLLLPGLWISPHLKSNGFSAKLMQANSICSVVILLLFVIDHFYYTELRFPEDFGFLIIQFGSLIVFPLLFNLVLSVIIFYRVRTIAPR